jgi:hypothetical protein
VANVRFSSSAAFCTIWFSVSLSFSNRSADVPSSRQCPSTAQFEGIE